MSSKTARLRRRQAANKRKYARLRKAGRVPQHTTAERRLAAAEREHKREADQRRHKWVQRATFTFATGSVAAEFVFGVPGSGHAEPVNPIAHYFPVSGYVAASGADNSHNDLPEVETADFPVYYAAGTATIDIRIGPVEPAWQPWTGD